MADPTNPSPQDLYKQWRSGDAAAGQAMAQRFSDWYYSVVSVRLGDGRGRLPLQRACLRFQQGITSVTGPNELIDWAYGLVAEEVKAAGDWMEGGDYPNQLTGGRVPSELLKQAASQMNPEDVALIASTFDHRISLEALTAQAEARGGMPLAILKARYALKTALKEHAGIPLQEVPTEPNLDYAPLPLYEAGRMASGREQIGFEKWMLSNLRICRDVAEFGVFSLSLRQGVLNSALSEEPKPPPPVLRPAPRPSEPRSSFPPESRHPESRPPEPRPLESTRPISASNHLPMVVGGIAGVIIALILLYFVSSSLIG